MTPKLAAAVGLALAVALVVPATAATPKAGSWSGDTKQNKSISFKVTPGGEKVKEIKFGFKSTCDNGARINGDTDVSGKVPVTDGKFRADLGNGSFVKGEFTGKKKAEGKLRSNAKTLDPLTNRIIDCSSGKVRWTADR